MSKVRSFSIYLLKDGIDEVSALKESHQLKNDVEADWLPVGAHLFVMDGVPQPPWWVKYFSIRNNLLQASKGCIVFLPVDGRVFAACFGHVSHNLKDVSYEYDFGARVTLNSVDPFKLRSTDILEPGAARRRRTQVPSESDLTFFDIDCDSSILKSLTGKVKDDLKYLFRNATGASNLRISTDVTSIEFPNLCKKLLEIYRSDDYKVSFPDIQNITPIRDPKLVNDLDQTLVEAVRSKDASVSLTVPDIVNYNDNMYVNFSGEGVSKIYEEAYIGNYYDYLKDRRKPVDDIDADHLKRHQLNLVNEEGIRKDSFSIYKSLVFEVSHVPGSSGIYHLNDGQWYRIETQFVSRLKNYLDPQCIDLDLPPYSHKKEGEYNKSVAENNPNYVCLDAENIAPPGQKPVEPCDLFRVSSDAATLFHVKISTLSDQLSHLFNQGANSAELLRMEPQSIEILRDLLDKKAGSDRVHSLISPVENQKFQVVYAIVTHKQKEKKSDNLPLFSRISLMRCLKSLKLMNVPCGYGFVVDASAKGGGVPKSRKKRAKKGGKTAETASVDLT